MRFPLDFALDCLRKGSSVGRVEASGCVVEVEVLQLVLNNLDLGCAAIGPRFLHALRVQARILFQIRGQIRASDGRLHRHGGGSQALRFSAQTLVDRNGGLFVGR